ncbi:hypothetical protein LTR12_013708 [Friedmanniomyces endolithicus]|nr:hypothetical protein LTR74_004592 [Friedmanniomyces endolithicus]KAK1811921.1 hypothetical protein LTR12_013708 [Friedmanniomyces endolithicus]
MNVNNDSKIISFEIVFEVPKAGVAEAPGAALELSLDDIRRKRPSSIKEHLVTLAKHRLPRTMGEVYTEVVVSCLTCLDEDNTEYANDEESGDVGGVLVGVRYIEQVLLKLNEISV